MLATLSVEARPRGAHWFDFELGSTPQGLPPSVLQRLALLTDAELAVLEDELDFFAFTGLRSETIAELLALINGAAVEAMNSWEGLGVA